MAKAFAVISSPSSPLPRVNRRTRFPFSYTADIPAPSILGSTQYSSVLLSMPKTFLKRSSKSSNSDKLKTLSKLNIGDICLTVANPSDKSLPILDEGESERDSWGYSASRARNLRIKESNSSSEITGAFSIL